MVWRTRGIDPTGKGEVLGTPKMSAAKKATGEESRHGKTKKSPPAISTT
jgi:hypothetical protein